MKYNMLQVKMIHWSRVRIVYKMQKRGEQPKQIYIICLTVTTSFYVICVVGAFADSEFLQFYSWKAIDVYLFRQVGDWCMLQKYFE